MKYKAIIYDLDNTLLETNRFMIQSIKKINESVKEEDIKKILKNNESLEYTFSHLFQNNNNNNNNDDDDKQESPLWQEMLARWNEEENKMTMSAPLQGVEIVKRFLQQGIVQGILTNRSKNTLKHLSQVDYPYFSFVIDKLKKEHKKPNPRALQPALEILGQKGITKQEVLSVGDHLMDYLASKEAGVDFVAVLTGLISKEEFIAAGLDEEHIIAELSELKKFFNIVKDTNN